jgi:molybdopterin synthase sulfur carrier subunit
MTVTILAFGIAKDIFNGSSIQLHVDSKARISNLKSMLEDQYPQLKDLRSFSIAVNQQYETDSYIIKNGDEIAIIPPVSGG